MRYLALPFLQVGQEHHHVLDYPFHQLVHPHQVIQLILRIANVKSYLYNHIFLKPVKKCQLCPFVVNMIKIPKYKHE